MEICITAIDHRASSYDVKDAVAKILHGPDFRDLRTGDRDINFHVRIDMNPDIETRNLGTGEITVPKVKIGERLLALVKKGRRKIVIQNSNRAMKLFRSTQKPRWGLVDMLLKAPYQDTSLERDREEKLRSLREHFRVDNVQFGIWGVRPSPSQKRRGRFCKEWEKSYTTDTNAQLWFDYDHKVLRMQLGDPATDTTAYNIVIRFSTLRNLWSGYDFGNPFLCLELLTPAIFESEKFHRTLSGDIHQDNKKYRTRIGFIDENHKRISPYAYHMRITFYDSTHLDEFIRLCDVVGLRRPIRAEIDSEGHDFFASKQLLKLNMELKRMFWSTAFQIEALLHNGLLTTAELSPESPLWREIARTCREQPSASGRVLRAFHEDLLLRNWSPFHPDNDDLRQIFLHVKENCLAALAQAQTVQRQGGAMDCYHVTFTPTRMSLEGPYAIQSNRVIRRYASFVDNFIRVDFRDEDRLQYHFEYEVDGEDFVREQVGGILKGGFSLAGRHFEFLGYSSSSLREHSVWFVHPFEDTERGNLKVTAASIRRSLGDFSGERLRPAKYAARLGQAFTATNPSISITAAQWSMVRDMGFRPYQHTDGNGTISRKLAILIWDKTGNDKKIMPSVWQIRFLGFKGVVSIDDELEGITMCLRVSMRKFQVHEVDVADIEIAQDFCFPNTMYLNRQLIMVLEGRGVPANAFLELQERTVAGVRSSKDNTEKLSVLLKSHNLGAKFGLVPLFRRLRKLNIGLEHTSPARCLDDPFFDRVINCAVDSVLRDIKHKARIPVPNSWHLVGVVDEGPAYMARDPRYTRCNTFALGEGQIFACVQTDKNSEPIYLQGDCIIGRSPTVHPGDVQRVRAIGKPPDGMTCLFRNLKNCVVLPCVGKRSLASCLGGGDVDGDTFQIIQYEPLLPRISSHQDPAEYPPVDTHKIKEWELIDPITKRIDEERIIPHVCDFIVEYINSDVLGLLSDKHLIRADQANEGIFDEGCLRLAELCSQAVDYPKNGKRVDPKKAPKPLIRYKPDWKEGEVEDSRHTDFYKSETAIGKLYRAVDLVHRQETPQVLKPSLSPTQNPVYIALEPLVKQMHGYVEHAPPTEQIEAIFKYYVGELRYICLTHTLTDYVGVRLSEEEVVIGTIMAHCSSTQRRWRQERIYRMGYHVGNLIQEVRSQLSRATQQTKDTDIVIDLNMAWATWVWTLERMETAVSTFGLHSFGIICLNAVLDCVEPSL